MIASATTFDTIPQALDYIIQKLDELHTRVGSLESIRTEPQDRWFDIKDLCDYLPQRPAPQTVYGWTSAKQIPYHKNGKKIIFLKSEIDAWLIGETIKSTRDLEAEAKEYVNSKRCRG